MSNNKDQNQSNKSPNLTTEELAEKIKESMAQRNIMQNPTDSKKAQLASRKGAKMQQKGWLKRSMSLANSLLKTLDSSIDFMANREVGRKKRDEVVQNARSPIVFGAWVIIICFGFFGTWASFAPLNQASIATGSIVVDSNRKTIQHKEGGIIKKILVKEGDEVQVGQVLMKLSDTTASANLEILTSRFMSLQANEDRLIAERDDAKELIFRQSLMDESENPEVAKILKSQRRIFETRTALYSSKHEITQKKIKQFNKQIEGINAQKYSSGIQLNKIKEQISVMNKLLKNGNANRNRLLDLESRQAVLNGQIGEYISRIAGARQQIASSEIEIMHDKNDMLNKIEQELKETQTHLIETHEKLNEANDLIERTEVKSPIVGTINNMSYHTIGGVVPPNGTILEIIPNDDKLVIEARVKPEDIDLVHPGLEAFANLNAYRARFVPPVKGVVVHVSADIISDPNAANPEEKSFYKAKIEIEKDQFEENPKLQDINLYPGMPASVLIVVGSRTFMRYLLDPILNTMRLSFREE